MYSTEHLVLAFAVGLITGVTSTILLNRKGTTMETNVSILIMSIWLAMHIWGFMFDIQVPWLLDFAGFGAAGNFVGISLADVRKFILKR
jgi:hypothetical protein